MGRTRIACGLSAVLLFTLVAPTAGAQAVSALPSYQIKGPKGYGLPFEPGAAYSLLVPPETDNPTMQRIVDKELPRVRQVMVRIGTKTVVPSKFTFFFYTTEWRYAEQTAPADCSFEWSQQGGLVYRQILSKDDMRFWDTLHAEERKQ